MKYGQIGPPVFVMLLMLLFQAAEPTTAAAQERDWEILTFFGGKGSSTDAFWFLYDAKRDRFIIGGRTEEQDLPVTPDAMKVRKTDPMDGFIAVFNGDCSELIYSSYIGGWHNDAVSEAIILDDDRILLAVGTYSNNLPTTGTVWSSTPSGIWLAVLSLETFEILHSGYFEGSTDDSVDQMLIGSYGKIIMTGSTKSLDLPVTSGAFQHEKGGNADHNNAFIAVFDSVFNLTFCSYHGGTLGAGEDAWNGLAETENYIVFTGTVASPDMPVTDDAYQKTYAGGWSDAYMVVVSKDSMRRVYSTYLGSSIRGGNSLGFEAEDGFEEVVSVGNDRVVLVGFTNGGDFPTTPNAWQPRIADDTSAIGGDIVIAVFSIPERRFEQITHLGGVDFDYAKSAIFDPRRREVLIAGTTASTDFPLIEPDSCECNKRGVLVGYDVDSLFPRRSRSFADIVSNDIQTIVPLSDGRLAFCGKTYGNPNQSVVPVRSTGFQTVRGGASDVIIGILRDKSTLVESLVCMAGDHTLQIHPQPTRGELRFAVEGKGNANALLLDLLGRKVIELPLAGDGTTIRGAMGLGSVSPGMYMLVVRTADMVRSGKVVVTK